ncbi:hypothetical protein PV458_34155 [Streptomyces sp. MN03-5084-2B]|nr:hypothetical protein [Streptomyces sp. MN03-5084-2B]
MIHIRPTFFAEWLINFWDPATGELRLTLHRHLTPGVPGAFPSQRPSGSTADESWGLTRFDGRGGGIVQYDDKFVAEAQTFFQSSPPRDR